MQRSLVLVLALCTSPAFAAGYEMKDLEALEKQESWQEIIEHLGDIPPSKRNDAWQRIAEKASAGILGKIDPKEEGGYGVEPRAIKLADAITAQYPTMGKSKAFMAARADAALKGYKVTYQNSRHSQSDDPWLDSLKKFVASDTTTPDLSLRAGKLITGRLVAYIAIPFFKPALQNNGGLCKDAEVKSAIVSAVTSHVWFDDGKAMADKCWGDVKDGIIAEVKKPDADSAKKNACPVLDAHKAAPPECKAE
jgi:hypothetical protein